MLPRKIGLFEEYGEESGNDANDFDVNIGFSYSYAPE
jgi:hypothetical protein